MPTFKPEQNFIREYKFETTKRPSAFYKTIGLHVLTVFSAFLFGFLYWRYLSGTSRIFYVLIALVIYLIFTSLEAILIKNIRIRSFIIALEVVALVLLFVKTSPNTLIAAILALAILATFGEITSRKKLSNSVSPSYFKIARSKTTRMVTALCLMVILFYAPHLDENNNLISRDTFDYLYNQVVSIAHRIYPNLNLGQSTADFAQSLANQSLQKDDQFLEMDEKNKETSVAQSGAKIITDLEKNFKIKIDPKDKLSDTAYSAVSSKLGDLRESLKDQFRLGWLIILFLIIRSFGFFITLIVSVIVEGLIYLMISLNFVHIVGENRTKESVKF